LFSCCDGGRRFYARNEKEFNNKEAEYFRKTFERWEQRTARDHQSDTEPTSRFDHPQGLFSLSYPQRWHRIDPVSKGAAFACRGESESVLIEVVCLERQPSALPENRHPVDVIVDGLVRYAAFETGMTRGRVIAQNSFPFGGAERCVDLLICYNRETESNAEISVDYFVIGTGRHALQIAMKTTTALFAANLRSFERLLGTLRTPWMQATGPPDLSSGTGVRRSSA
jgi:hypothetical protein